MKIITRQGSRYLPHQSQNGEVEQHMAPTHQAPPPSELIEVSEKIVSYHNLDVFGSQDLPSSFRLHLLPKPLGNPRQLSLLPPHKFAPLKSQTTLWGLRYRTVSLIHQHQCRPSSATLLTTRVLLQGPPCHFHQMMLG